MEIYYSEINKYLLDLLPKREQSKILAQAEDEVVPIISLPVENFLKLTLRLKNPKNILEIGTAIGYSAKIIRECCPNSEITSIEKCEDKYNLAKENLKNSRANLILGDALEILPNMNDKFDFIFLDFAKSLYIKILPFIIETMNKNAILFCDNVLCRGQVCSDKEPEHKHRTQIKNLQRFIKELTSNDKLQTSIIPIDDGIALSIKV